MLSLLFHARGFWIGQASELVSLVISLVCSVTNVLVQLGHHLDELVELDLAVAIFIDLLDDGVDSLGREGVGATEAEDLTDFISGDDTRAVLVEHAEGCVQFLL